MGTVITSGSCLSDSMRSTAWPKGVPKEVPNTRGVRPGIAGSGMAWSLLRLDQPGWCSRHVLSLKMWLLCMLLQTVLVSQDRSWS